MNYVEIFQAIFIIAVFSIGLIGFLKAATSDDKKED
ncbi:MAG: hypothetical protein ACJAWW_000338 [Sulfurimonas sp.]|jgi:hypothetical protein